MRKTYTDLYEKYKANYNGKPKYNYEHFLRVIEQIDYHRSIIRPQIKWWKDKNKKS